MATIQKRNQGGKDVYRVRYRDAGGTQRSRTFKLKGQADAFYKTIGAQEITGGVFDPSRGTIRLEDWWTLTEGKGVHGKLAPKSVAFESWAWDCHVKPRFGSLRLTDITRGSIQDWIDDLSATLMPSSVRKIGGTLRRLLALAVRDDRVSLSPYSKVQLPEVEDEERRFLTPAELIRLEASMVAGCQQHDPPTPAEELANEREKVKIPFLADSGLRIGELAGLQWDDLDLMRLLVHVRRNFTEEGGFGPPKTRAGRRSVPMLTPEVGQRLAALRGNAEGSDLVFPAPDGGPLRPRNWRKRVFNPAVLAAGLTDPQPTPHALRHTAVAHWIEIGVTDQFKLTKWAGHRSAATLYKIYGHLFEYDATAERDKLTALRVEARKKEEERRASAENVIDLAAVRR